MTMQDQSHRADVGPRRVTAKSAPAAEESARTTEASLPDDIICIVPVRNVVLFPGIVMPLSLGRAKSIAAAQEAARGERPIGVLLQRVAEADDPAPEQLYEVGTLAGILRYVTAPDGNHHIVCQGQQRFRVRDFVPGYPFPAARIGGIDAREAQPPEIEARLFALKERAMEALQLLPQVPPELINAVQSAASPSIGADLVSSFMDLKVEEKQEILETEGTAAEIEELDKAIAEAGMPEEAEQQARKELKRLERMPEAAAEHSMVRTYLDWLIELPWAKLSDDAIDIANARQILDEDHFGLDKIKRRILEYLAVRKLNPTGKSPILCFVGPPGVGKTSLGQSIARATGREFVRTSLGGVHDEAEIRGHRRTYIGALPGNIIQGIRKAGTRNPVFMLDELDKLGAGFHGDPSSALLEVLDPEQNNTFRDNYLAVPFDLSRVMFIATANVLDTIPGPLRDRMEILQLPSYTEDEKVEIARRYLVRRQLEANGLTVEQAEITEAALRALVRDYTREAGVRNLERQIGAVLRNIALRIAESSVERGR